jgi:Erv1 / Alr family
MSELKRSTWGSALWTYLHTAASAVDNPDALVQIIEALPKTLPCPECRQHSDDYLSANPPAAAIRDVESASRYVFEFHNAVNLRLGKPAAHPRVLHARHGVLLPEAVRPARQFERVKPYRMI